MFRALKGKKRDISYYDESIVWGIRCRRGTQLGIKMLADDLKVPIGVLVTHIVEEWVKEIGAKVIYDRQFRQQLSDFLANKYLKQQVDQSDEL